MASTKEDQGAHVLVRKPQNALIEIMDASRNRPVSPSLSPDGPHRAKRPQKAAALQADRVRRRDPCVQELPPHAE